MWTKKGEGVWIEINPHGFEGSKYTKMDPHGFSMIPYGRGPGRGALPYHSSV